MDDHGCVLLGSVLRSTEACVYSVCGIIGGKRLIGFFDMFWSRVLSIGIISFFLGPVKDLGRQEDRVAGFRSWVRGSGLTAMERGKWWLDCCKLHCEWMGEQSDHRFNG